jgi:hypothetical protein
MAVSVIALGLITWLIFVTATDDTWKPLGPYPEQSVITDETFDWANGETYSTGSETIPAVRLSAGEVTVEGTKCNDTAVTVDGSKAWTSMEPPGFTFDEGAGTGTRPEGCSTRTFTNPIPAEVAAWAEGRLPVVVAIGGCETPVDPDRGEGAELCWRTEPFALIEG